MALLVDSYEALLAAIYLDRGIEAAREFVRRQFAETLAEIDPQDLTATDYKTALQERLQSVGLPTPHYAIIESLGPDHRRLFRVELRVNGQCFATGEGATIKGAHQAAARAALDIFDTEIEKLKETHPSDGNAGIETLKATHPSDDDSGDNTPAVESPPDENGTRVPITDTIF
jgi:dsRNA-specific ribonuclease